MNTLVDVYNSLAPIDAELEKQASQLVKQAQEEDAAGRITARGFIDELNKLAAVTRRQFVAPAVKPIGSNPAYGNNTNLNMASGEVTKKPINVLGKAIRGQYGGGGGSAGAAVTAPKLKGQ